MRRTFFATAAAVSIVSLTSILGVGSIASAQSEPGTIVEVASANPDFSTLVTAVTKAELVETLSGKGPFTVFAPTNKAFDALPAGTLDSLLADPKGKLADILKLHVLSGAVDSKAAIAAAGGTVETLGGPITVALDGEKLIVGGATVVTTDLKASNGIIHVIDAVITQSSSAPVATSGSEAEAPASDAPAADVPSTEAAAAAADSSETAAAPARVETGDDGLAATSTNNNGLLIALGAFAAIGLISSTVLVARNRRRG
jgi:transforming growth factor-beta-induced protein